MKMTNRLTSLYKRVFDRDDAFIKKDEKPSVRSSMSVLGHIQRAKPDSTGVLRYVWRDKESVSETTLAICLKKQLVADATLQEEFRL